MKKNTPLMNKSQLAEYLGRSKSYISAMVKAGFETPCGRTSAKAAIRWMAAHPDFRVADAYKRETKVSSRRKSARETHLTPQV